MSEKKDELVNTPSSPAPEKNGSGSDGKMREVDQGTQEKAAEEREKSGGYD